MTKRILITGKNSYIGQSVLQWLKNFYPQPLIIDELCLEDESWKNTDFSSYNTILHVAGIAHADIGKANNDLKRLYRTVNTNLAISVATKAKSDGVTHFIFMSSIIVFGDSAPIGKQKRITANSTPEPANFYGDSKLQAEIGINALQDKNFKIAIIRPPMVYGNGAKGNYQRLVKLAQRLPLFPAVKNERSMIHIDNLCEFIRLIINDQATGTFHPQNAEYVQTSNLVALIAKKYHKNLRLIRFLTPFLQPLARIFGSVNKMFGNLSYDMSLSEYQSDYQVRSFDDSIEITKQ